MQPLFYMATSIPAPWHRAAKHYGYIFVIESPCYNRKVVLQAATMPRRDMMQQIAREYHHSNAHSATPQKTVVPNYNDQMASIAKWSTPRN